MPLWIAIKHTESLKQTPISLFGDVEGRRRNIPIGKTPAHQRKPPSLERSSKMPTSIKPYGSGLDAGEADVYDAFDFTDTCDLVF
jgi:hypothetical protein